MCSFLGKIQEEQRTYAFCWLLNIGIEGKWCHDRFRVKSLSENRIVEHIEEILLLLARKQDVLLLRRQPDAMFLKELEEMGYEIPEIICPSKEDETKSITGLILEDEKMLVRLKEKALADNMCLIPYGVTDEEEALAESCNMKMVGSASAITYYTNSKLYAKQLAEKLRLPSPEGKVCTGADEICKTWNCLRKNFRSIVIKRPYGASGQGLYLTETCSELRRVLYILKRLGIENKKCIVEGWYDEKEDLNAQLYICENGSVEVFSVKKQILEGAVYRGAVFPVELPENIKNQYVQFLKEIGAELFQDGVRGVVGVDSVLTKKVLFPAIEINVRFTLSTYLSTLPIRFLDRYFCSMYYRISLSDDWNYIVLIKKLKSRGLFFDKEEKEGVFFYNHACIDPNVVGKTGRLFVVFVAKQKGKLWDLRLELEKILEAGR